MSKVLIVDDSRTSRKMLANILAGAGHEIIGEAVNGEDGFLKYKELKPEVVTLDITMPKMDGIEALKLIRNFDDEAVVVMVTAAGQTSKITQAIKNGASLIVCRFCSE